MNGAEQVKPAADAEPQRGPVPTQAREWLFTGRDDCEAGLRQHLLPLHCMPVDARSYRCGAVIAPLCDAVVGDLHIDASTWLRRQEEVAKGGDEMLQVLWQQAGRSRIRQGRQVSTIEPESWTVCDAGREYAIDFEPNARCLVLVVPRSQCLAWLSAIDRLAALPLSANGPARVARSILCAVLHDRAALNARSERAAYDAVISLLEHALQRELAQRHLPLLRRRVVDLGRVQAYVMDRLNDKSLTVERIAEAFGMSRRSIYNLFASVGVTPRDFIQAAKLARAGELLRDPAWSGAPILHIAELCGFADAAHFSRSFHAHHGSAPHAWRRQA